MASYNLLYFILASFLSFATIEAQDVPIYLASCCFGNETTANSVFQLDLRTLLSSLSYKNTEFYNNTVTSKDPSSDSTYGLFMCRGDIPSQLCHQCVLNATQRLLLDCSLSKQAVIWYDECIVMYSNHSVSSIFDRKLTWKSANVSKPERFNPLLYATMNQTADEASIGGDKKFAIREASVSRGPQKLYCLAQCTPDFSPNDCRMCLSNAIGILHSSKLKGKVGGRVLYTSCNIRYELYPFYRSISPSLAPAFVPETNYSNSKLDSRFLQDPFYLFHNCTTTDYDYSDSYFQDNIKNILSSLSLKATNGERYYKIDDGELFGLFMCRGDISPPLCQQCVKEATHQIRSKCYSFKEAIIWYSHCMLRYSDHNFFSQMDTRPAYSELNVTNNSRAISGQNSFIVTLSNLLDQLADDTANNFERYMTKSLKLNDVQTLYTIGQCTMDLSYEDCRSCLEDVVATAIPWSNLGSIGGRVLYPSCNLRFEMFKFYRDADQTPMPNNQGSYSQLGHSEKQNDKPRTITFIVVPTIIFVMLFYFGYYLLKRRGRMSRRTILKENFGHESATLEPLQFDLAVIQAATNNFSNDNYLGKGGFGEVYKGVLFDGRQIAVKKLSRSSKQGVEEFKNEVLLIAKLQHRNLVAFIGFCLEVQEKMLIYEFVPNKSLDYFLFDSKSKLSWAERYNIIRGIVRGILYLHEHSRLKVIHRDLKPSNILLDEHMIPKISDFGLARIVEISQDHGSTNRIVGTFGYMSPEYAMRGQFSEKSDIFSFGVMILEIVAGKKNVSSHEEHYVVDGLLNYAWRQWRDQTPLSILDPNIKADDSKIEVIRCIQIGLLCIQHNPDARPTMMAVISYLNNDSIDLPTPQEPAFFLHGRMDSTAVANKNIVSSENEMSISTFIPR